MSTRNILLVSTTVALLAAPQLGAGAGVVGGCDTDGADGVGVAGIVTLGIVTTGVCVGGYCVTG